MKKTENHCVDCGLPCLGISCPHREVTVDYCDGGCENFAEYRIDGEDLCEVCCLKRVQEIFDELDLYEKAEAIGVRIKTIDF